MKRIGKLFFVFLGICLGGVLVFFGINYYSQLSPELEQQEVVSSESPKNVFPKVEDQQSPLEIWALVQSCTKQKKKWAFPDGLGGAGFPKVFFQDGKLMIEYWQEMEDLDTRSFDWIEDKEWFPYSWAKEALELGAQTNLLQKLNYVAYDDGQLYCVPSDEDCKLTYEAGAWSDGKGNYFVAGYQKGKNEYKDLVYLINGKLYIPARQTTIDYRRTNKIFDKDATGANSHWFFGGFKDGKLLVKRYLDYKYVGGFTTIVNEYWPQKRNTSEYILETCELEL